MGSQKRNPFPTLLVKFNQSCKTLKENWPHQVYWQLRCLRSPLGATACRGHQKGHSFPRMKK